VRRAVGWCGIGCLVLGIAAGCGDPDQQLRSEGARAAREAASAVGTAELAGQSFLDHKLWSQPATQLVSEAEQSLGKVSSTFDQQQPRTRASRKTYDDVSKTLDEAAGNVTDLRIALTNGDKAGVAELVKELTDTTEGLRRLGETEK
jgi:phosphohistidine phosphatase SixA